MAREATLDARCLRGSQPIIHHPVALGFPHPARRYRPGGSAFSFSGFNGCRDMERFPISRWKLISLGCRETSALARGATLSARWRHGPQSIRNHPVGLGIPPPAGRYRPGGSAFSSTDCSSCRDIEIFLIRRWELFLPVCGGTSALARGQLSPRASSMGPIQSAITQWGWGFHTLRTGIDTEVLRFPPRVVSIIKIPNNF